MPKPPIHTVHIIYDDAVNEEQLITCLRDMAEQVSAKPEIASLVRFSVMKMGHLQDSPSELKMFRVADQQNYAILNRADLRSAFNHISFEYKTLDKNIQGTKNPEILLLLGSKPVSDWQLGWKEVEPFRALILTYWISAQPLDNTETRNLEMLLSKISPSDPDKKHLRYRICILHDENQSSFLKEVFSKLINRLEQRLSEQIGKVY